MQYRSYCVERVARRQTQLNNWLGFCSSRRSSRTFVDPSRKIVREISANDPRGSCVSCGYRSTTQRAKTDGNLFGFLFAAADARANRRQRFECPRALQSLVRFLLLRVYVLKTSKIAGITGNDRSTTLRFPLPPLKCS